MIKSINLWSFPSQWTLAQCFERAARAGFSAVEPNFTLTGALSMESSDGEIAAVRRMAGDCGVALASLSTDVYWESPPTHADAAVRQRALRLVRRQLEAAALLGVGAILVVPGLVGADFLPDMPPVPYDAAYDRALEFAAQAARHAEACGVILGVENVWNKFLLSPLEMRGFLDSVGSPFVRAYFDVGNVLPFGYPEQWVHILGRRIARVHVKDFKLSVGNLNGFTDLLCGDVNFPEVVRALTETGYDGFITAEVSGYRHYADQIIENTSAALDRILTMR